MAEATLDTTQDGVKTTGGAFAAKLMRPNSQIKGDRAVSAIEDAEMFYMRELQDLQVQYKKLSREQENAYDLSPGSKDSLNIKEFDPKQFVLADIEAVKKLVNLKKIIDAVSERFEYLFGKKLPA